MDLKKFISGISALSVAASAFAAVTITASAAVVNTTTYDFSTTTPANPTLSRWSNTAGADPVDATNQTMVFSPASNSGNGTGAYAYYDLSSLIPADVTSYTVSYKAYFPHNTSARWTLGLADLNKFTFARYGYDTTDQKGMIGQLGHFTDDFIRVASGGNRNVLSGWSDTVNSWVTVTDTVNVAAGTWSTSMSGIGTYSANGTLSDGDAYDKLLIYGYAISSGGAVATVYIDDLTITTTAPDPGAATAVEVNYTLSGSTVATDTKNISSEGLLSGAEYSFHAPAYVVAGDGKIYSTGLKGYNVSTKKTVSLVEGTTTVEIPVSLEAETGAFFETENVISNGVEVGSDYASMGKGVRRLDQKQMTVTAPANGIYTVKAGFVSAKSSSTVDTVSAYKDAYSAEATALFSFTQSQTDAYRGSEMSQADVELKAGDKLVFHTGSWNTGLDYVLLVKTGDLPTAVATLEEDNITDDTQYTGADAGATYSVFKATVTAGTNAITSLYFTLNSGAKSTDEYNETTITEGSSAIFGLIVPMASADVTDITAVIDGDSYVAFE